ncbi:MAG: hypothetical protein H0U75_06315 [Legionella sp.]|nr:hypothetical protein [Legionella sp.]
MENNNERLLAYKTASIISKDTLERVNSGEAVSQITFRSFLSPNGHVGIDVVMD